MQTEGGGWIISRKMSLRKGTCGTYNVIESQKVKNDSPSFAHICIKLRAPATRSVGQPGIRGAARLLQRQKQKSILGVVWEEEVESVVPSSHSGVENAVTLARICSSSLKPAFLFLPSHQGGWRGAHSASRDGEEFFIQEDH